MESVLHVSQPIEFNDHEALCQDLDLIAQGIHAQGYPCRAYTPASLSALRSLSQEKVAQLRSFTQSFAKLILSAPAEIIRDNGAHPERALVERALDFYGMDLHDDYWAHVRPTEIIELYSADEVQIFRTMNFFKYSSYSLADLLNNEWFHLWERPAAAIEKMLEVSRACLRGERPGITSMQVPTHVLREIFDAREDGAVSRSILIDFGVICPVYRKGTNQIAGFLVSCGAEIMTEGADTHNIRVL